MAKVSLFTVLLLISGNVLAQQTPVVNAARQILASRQKNMVAAVEEMPEARYSFKPTAGQMTFGHMVEHMAKSNYFLCAKLAGTIAPTDQTTEKDGKNKLVSALKNSFDYCSGTLQKITESQLADPVELWGGKQTTKAGALFDLTNDWADHYAAAATYLRLNGLLPPTAKAKQ